jgi:hypothetical protein
MRPDCRLDAGCVRMDVSLMQDQLLPQPPPDAPAPPPGEEALRSRRKMWWLLWIGICSVLSFALLPLFLPRRRGPHNSVGAVNNARQIGLALFEFESEYGRLPDSSTVAAVRHKTLPDRTSNDLFAQLIASGIVASEHVFYAKAKSMRKPDNVFATDATVLEHGECAFAYFAGVSMSRGPRAALAFAPVIPGTTTLDRKSCEGYAIILWSDNSATKHPITPAGKLIYNGLDLLDPRQPFWRGKAPDVKWPK